MTRKGSSLRASRWALALWMATVMMFASFAPAARAQPFDGAVASAGIVDAQSTEPPAEIDRWWGVAAAAGCGLEGRLIVSERLCPA